MNPNQSLTLSTYGSRNEVYLKVSHDKFNEFSAIVIRKIGPFMLLPILGFWHKSWLIVDT